MDNLTHSLAGLAVGELIHRTLPPEPDAARQSTRRRMLLVSCWAANNFPDLDLLLKGRLPEPIGYLLDHRGHTHTLLFALPQALLLMALVWLLWPAARSLLRTSSAARLGLVAASGIGLAMHIGFDFLNSYGVHPFYPFDARWLYGDTLFIVEPLLWMAFGAPLIMMLRRRWLKIACGLLLGGIFAASLVQEFLHWSSVAALLAVGGALAAVQLRSGERGRQALAAGMLVAVCLAAGQALVALQGKQAVTARLAQLAPEARVLDVAMTPFPANPLCWSFVSVERDDAGGLYRLRRGMYAPLPGVVPVGACPPGLALKDMTGTPQIGLGWQHQARLADLRALAAHCYGRAWLRFARMPAQWPDGATDARFSPEPGPNFTTMPLEGIAGLPCPTGIPEWGMPRADLLR